MRAKFSARPSPGFSTSTRAVCPCWRASQFLNGSARFRANWRRVVLSIRRQAAACVPPVCWGAAKTETHAQSSNRNHQSGGVSFQTWHRSRSENRQSDRHQRQYRVARFSISQNASASARLWRRFMRFKIISSPACSDKCKCGIRRGS